MKLNIYTIFDRAAKAFVPPFYQKQDGEAIRSFEDAINLPGHPMFTHPEDYTLYKLGVFDDEKAAVYIDPEMTKIAAGLTLKHEEVNYELETAKNETTEE